MQLLRHAIWRRQVDGLELEQKLGLMFCSISLKNGFGGDGDLSIDGDLNFFTQGLISDGKMGMGRD